MASTNPCYFRRRPLGRAASPPTWACYEQIPYEDECSYSESGSEESCSEEEDIHEAQEKETPAEVDNQGQHVESMEIDDAQEPEEPESKKDVKGKQRAVEPQPEPEPSPRRRQRRKQRQPVYTLRPILTIQKSQGFVWNQDLFVPPYIKDRYVASTSPPNARGFISSSASSTTSALNDYEIEVVEIRVQEGELNHIIP